MSSCFEDILMKFAQDFEKFCTKQQSLDSSLPCIGNGTIWNFRNVGTSKKWCVGDILYLYSDCVSYFEPRRSSAACVQICNVQHRLTKFERWALSRFRVQKQTDLVTPSAMMMNYGNSVEAAGVSTSRLFSGGDSLGDVRVVVHHWLHYMIFSWQVLRFFCHNH